MLTLINEFHGTETKIRAQVGDILTTTQAARIFNRLCGMGDCGCGGTYHSRYDLTPVSMDEYEVVDRSQP